jgi:chaperonin GroES
MPSRNGCENQSNRSTFEDSMKPLHNKVLVERIAGETTTNSGIVLKSSSEPDRAKVLAVGPEAKEVFVGDVVLLDWNAAQKASGETYVIKEDFIVFVYEE